MGVRAASEARTPVRECGVKYQVSWEDVQKVLVGIGGAAGLGTSKG